MGTIQKTKRNDNNIFKNPLEVDLTVIGSLRRMFVSRRDTSALT